MDDYHVLAPTSSWTLTYGPGWIDSHLTQDVGTGKEVRYMGSMHPVLSSATYLSLWLSSFLAPEGCA